MAYCRNEVLVFCVFEVGLVSNLEPLDPFKMNERMRNYEAELKRKREEKLNEFEIEESLVAWW
ncbi:hypothetical protein MtrunA17_Chr2g0326231 [Medicago truncatula]|uniref:Uncharacterized protein n=1 Tax=Medicago truncatula TaxID=3880 RepID=A0A396JHW7_MEDTR|nr:hypothetical protein MtrunA17_Chr2g0326231 [Medicago truncatula]